VTPVVRNPVRATVLKTNKALLDACQLWLAALLLICIPLAALGQTAPGSLQGTVTDPSGAVVVNAMVATVTADGKTVSATTNKNGIYELHGLMPGKYTITANARGFAVFVQDDVEIAAGISKAFNISLDIDVQQQKVDVQETTTQVDTSADNNVGAIIMKGKDLDALSDDPDELLSDLQALAGPSAGPNGGQLYIDGFTAGQMPPKSSIREIRINQNPFSAQFDKLGYGRIEVFTKPGTDKWHGQVSVIGNSSAFNSHNPFLATEPDYHSTQYQGNVAGPINKSASFFVDFQRRNIDEVNVVNATILNPSCVPDLPTPACNLNPGSTNFAVPYTTAYPNPHTRTTASPRFDFQLSKNNTLTARYQFWQDVQDNDGVGGLTLPSQGYNNKETEHTIQISDTQVISPQIVNETRFQYLRDLTNQIPLNSDTSLSVAGAFSSGGSAQGEINDNTDHYELQNYTSIAHGAHLIKFGARIRGVQETNNTTTNFNGTYTFPSIEAYAATFLGVAQQATQYTQVSGGVPPGGTVSQAPVGTSNIWWMDAGLYVQDEWKFKPNLTLGMGLRFETQNRISNHADWAPRLSFAWGIDGSGNKAAKTVLRGGFGMFYDRFNEEGILSADRFNGLDQVSYIVTNPLFSVPPQPPGHLTTNSPTIYQINPDLHAPYVMQTALSLERQMSKNANLAVSYLTSRGVHQYYLHNVNAPHDPTQPDVRPLGNLSNVYQYASDGTYKQNQLIVNSNVRVGTKVSLFGNYTLNYANANTSGGNSFGPSSFSSNQYSLTPDWGRASFDRRHRLFLVGTIAGPYALRFSPFIVAVSGSPYNVTVGQDLNSDSIFNDRPAFAADDTGACLSPISVCHYNPVPGPDQARVPINYLTGPTTFSVNLRVSKTFGFGKETGGPAGGDGGPGGPGGGGHSPGAHGAGGFGRAGGSVGLGSATNRRYALTFSVNARNLFNRENLGTPIGDLTSPKFGQSVGLVGGPFSSQAASRKIELQASFSF
jgi:Carboxypeptidase regulatory-like domain